MTADPIEFKLTGGTQPEAADPDELLLDAFRRVRRRCRGAVVGINARTMITNSAASELLGPTDRYLLRIWMQTAGEAPEGAELTFDLATGVPATARLFHVGIPGRRVGLVLHILPLTGPGSPRAAVRRPVSATLDPTLLTGWAELTDSERAVAELVSRGLSNKEVARKLFVSRHTVDHHLRGVFRKLGVSSRVDLARLVGEHYESLMYPECGDAAA